MERLKKPHRRHNYYYQISHFETRKKKIQDFSAKKTIQRIDSFHVMNNTIETFCLLTMLGRIIPIFALNKIYALQNIHTDFNKNHKVYDR